jgi:hypothetical protein
MKTMRQLMGIICMTCLIYGLPVLTHATIVTLGDGSKYEIYLESHVGNTWTYSVSEVSGKSLSHWNVGIPSCIGHITDYSPTGGYDTTDGSTSFDGIKWDVAESFTSGTFSVTLDADYPETTVLAQAKAGKKGNERTGEVRGPDCNSFSPPNTVEQPCDFVYGVHDEGLNDSYLFKVNPTTMVFEPLGSPCIDCDIESTDISPEPNVLYGAAGDDTPNPGQLYKIDMVTGDLERIGEPSGYEIDGISFNPVTGELVGWAQGVGLLRIDPDTGDITVGSPSKGEIEDLTWANDGKTIYFILNDYPVSVDPDASLDHSVGQKLMSYNDNVLEHVCGIESESEIEALEVLPNDDLLIGYHNNGKQLVKVVNVETCEVSFDGSISESPYNDIEGIAVCPPEVQEP